MAGRLHVAAPTLDPRITFPALATELRLALSAELARRGVKLAARRGAAATVLRSHLRAHDGSRVALVDGERLAARAEVIRVELRLEDGAGKAVWRSGYVEVRAARSVPSETLRGAEHQRWLVGELARRAAALAVERLWDRGLRARAGPR